MPGLYIKMGRGTLQPGKKYRLTGRTFLIGRSDQADIRLHSDVASREHAVLRLEGERWFVVDLGSRNGTYVNGRRVNNAALRPMDRLKFGPGGSKFGIISLDPAPPMEDDSREVLPDAGGDPLARLAGHADAGAAHRPAPRPTPPPERRPARRPEPRERPRPTPPPERRPSPATAPPTPAPPRPSPGRSRRTSDIILLTLGCLAVLVVLVLFVTRPRRPETGPVQPAEGPPDTAVPSTTGRPTPMVPSRPKKVVVPSLYGLTREQAERRLGEVALRWEFADGEPAGPFETAGCVQSQEPRAGEVVLQGTLVKVRLCR
jgi:pSer/pThr/pTyr-binding forkhead associated (FHA) protein